jgi:NTE family protein
MQASTPPPPHQDDLLLQHLRSFLGIVDEEAIASLRRRVRWMHLPGGETLMRQGEPGDALYLLVSGRLRVYVEEDGQRRVVREISRGEVIGEMSVIADAPRSATVAAIRDSVLVSLGKEDFVRLQTQSPAVTLALTRQIIERLRTEGRRTIKDRPVMMALLPISAGVDAGAFAQSLARELAQRGRVSVLNADWVARRLKEDGTPPGDERGQRRLATLLAETEDTHDYVILVGDAAPSEWTGCCTRHADEILLLADARAQPAVHPTEQAFLAAADRRPNADTAEILVLLHPAGAETISGTSRWLARRPVSDHVHVRLGVVADMARLARIQSRQAVGLVLGGGGARGFAHLGVYRALEERGIEVDYVGGTSIGAAMAAMIASAQSWTRLAPIARVAFSRNPTGDFAFLPFISLFTGRRLRRVVRRAAIECAGADAGIEDLWKGFFCVASNFSKAKEVVLRRGDLARAVLASSAIPGALPPVILDGDLLCDGGMFNNFPADVMRTMRGVGTVIGVDLSSIKARRLEIDEVPSGWALLMDRFRPRRSRRYRLPTLPVLLINSTVLYSMSRQQQARAATDLYFNPQIERVGMLDWKRFDQAFRQGYEHAVQVLEQTGASVQPHESTRDFGLPPHLRSTHPG